MVHGSTHSKSCCKNLSRVCDDDDDDETDDIVVVSKVNSSIYIRSFKLCNIDGTVK